MNPNCARTAAIRIPTIVLTFTLAVAARAEMMVQVSAGKYDRPATVATILLPESLTKAPAVQMRFGEPERSSVPTSQRTEIDGKPAMAWIVGPMKAGETRTFRLLPGAILKGGRPAVWCEKTDERLTVTVNKQELLQYNLATNQPPQGAPKVYARGAYIHPVKSPSGLTVTNDFPEKHLHHHGIWFPWTETVFEGKKTDFWNMGKAEGTVEFVKVEATDSGSVFGSFRVQQKHVALKAAGGKKDALNETWDVRVYNFQDYYVFDFTSTQTCASESPLTLKQYHYGGLGVRGAADWEGDACRFLTSEGKNRLEGHATAAKWCAMSGRIGKEGAKTAGIAILGHPSNFRAPQKMRLHPDEPFFNFAPEQDGDFDIVPGRPYVSRYRFVVFDGETDAKLCDTLWNDFAEPVEVKEVK